MHYLKNWEPRGLYFFFIFFVRMNRPLEWLPAEVANILIKPEEDSPSPPLINSLSSVDGNLAAPRRRTQTQRVWRASGVPLCAHVPSVSPVFNMCVLIGGRASRSCHAVTVGGGGGVRCCPEAVLRGLFTGFGQA